jgi:hypothetical protein
MSHFTNFINFTDYFLKYKSHPTRYFKKIYHHLSKDNGLYRLDFAKYMDLNLLISNSVFVLFSKDDYFTCDDFSKCLENIYSKSFDVCIAFIFSLLDLDKEKTLSKRNVEIILYNIVGREKQKSLFSVIDDMLNKFFETEFLNFERFRTKIQFENSDILFIILSYFYGKKPFDCRAVDIFYCLEDVEEIRVEIVKPTYLLKHFIKDYDEFLDLIKFKEEEDDLIILNDDVNLNYLPSVKKLKNIFNTEFLSLKPTRKEFKRHVVTFDQLKKIHLDEKTNSNNSTTDTSLYAEISNELYIYNNQKISKHLVTLLGKDIIEMKIKKKILINLTHSYILYDILQTKIINDEKYYSFTLYNNGKFINIISKKKSDCKEWKNKINKCVDFKNFNKFYKIISTISVSKFNIVNLGFSLKNNKDVIIKMFRKFDCNNSNLEYFMMELSILKNTKHPNIVDYIESFEDKDFIYIIMEKIQYSLPNYMSNNLFTKQELYTIINQMGCGIQYLHKLGIVHRDIKLDNICIGKEIKIIDFGLSAYISRKQKLKLKCGTESYISPEIYLNQAYDQKTDIWSFGLVIYKLVNYIRGEKSKESNYYLNLVINSKFELKNKWTEFDELKCILTSCICKESKRLCIDKILEKLDQ